MLLGPGAKRRVRPFLTHPMSAVGAFLLPGAADLRRFHIGAGHAEYRYRKAAKPPLSPNFYWSSLRGPYASVRLPGGFRVGVTASD